MNRPILDSAIEFATIAHTGQRRKGTDIPYIVHPYTVGMYLKAADCGDEVGAAGILHDVLEDTAVTFEELAAAFGKPVADLVQAVSEPDKALSWEERKSHTLQDLKTASLDVKHIACADKLHNIRTVNEAIEQVGEEAWQRFKTGRKEQEWYYRGLVEVLCKDQGAGLFREFEEAVQRCFGGAGE